MSVLTKCVSNLEMLHFPDLLLEMHNYPNYFGTH